MAKPSEVIIALADMASRGKYDNVTPVMAKQWDRLFVLVAELINKLEEQENNQLEQQKQHEAAQASDDEESVSE